MLGKNGETQAGIPWAIHLQAIAIQEPERLMRMLTNVIISYGGWFLSRGLSENGQVTLLFEFERYVCVEVYSSLIGAGLELSRVGHLQFTELCQCTRSSQTDCETEIATIDLEIQTYPPENASQSNALLPS